jgi:hypothetical protein
VTPYFFGYFGAGDWIWHATTRPDWADVINVLGKASEMDASGRVAWFCVLPQVPRRVGERIELEPPVSALAVGCWANQLLSVKLWTPEERG